MKRRDLLKRLGMTAGGVLSKAPAWMDAAAEAPGSAQSDLATPRRGLVRKGDTLLQPVTIALHPVTGSVSAVTTVDGVEKDRRTVQAGETSFDILLDPVTTERQISIRVDVGGTVQTAQVTLKPVRRVTVYVLPHSHHDLGYTDLQADVEEKQMRNITRGMELARKTATYPEGSRFVWNLEVLWGADLFLQRRSPEEKAELLDAIRKGQIALNGSYANELTGLCRPEELLTLFKYSTQLSKEAGVKTDAAMMSDVPGFTWGTVTAMSQAGIRYFSAAPNFFDRIGTFMVTWQDKPFWWVSPSGKEKVLFWVPWTGYAMSHVMKVGPEWVSRYQDRLDAVEFPYDISYIRWSGHGDNAEPDPEISDFVRDWNAAYEWPKFAIASTSAAFSAFEAKYGDQIPSHRGDLTPYWEDGAGSSALETGMSRVAADRLTQSATLAAMLSSGTYRSADYDQAWRDVLLYSEHTWGAWCSVSDSENPFTTKQWAYKRDFAVKAQSQSEALLARSLAAYESAGSQGKIDIHNATSWERSEVVLVSPEQSMAGDHVVDSQGRPVRSQRLSTGELAVLVKGIPAFASARYTLSAKAAHQAGEPVRVREGVLENEHVRVCLDPESGDIHQLSLHGREENLIDVQKGALNQYLFLAGTDVAHLQHSGRPAITVEDHGPLVASVSIESSAPGCKRLVRHVRLTAGADYVAISNTVDKERAALNPHPGKGDQGSEFAQSGSKESVQFAFPFLVPQGKMTMDVGLAVMRPEIDQLAGSCKNWLPVGRWVDVSNAGYGVTWVTLDAPLVELGGITATMLGSQKNPAIWRTQIEPTQTVYSWVMNNHWGTNYRAYQEGPTTFRYALHPHRGDDAAAVSRFAIGQSQPMLISKASDEEITTTSLLRVEPAEVLVTAFKPSDDGKSWILRLFGASGGLRQAKLVWRDGFGGGKVWISNVAEEPLHSAPGEIPVAGWELVTLRVDRV